MDDTTSPLESGLAWTVDTKTDATSSAAPRSARAGAARSSALVLLDQGVLRSHQPVRTRRTATA